MFMHDGKLASYHSNNGINLSGEKVSYIGDLTLAHGAGGRKDSR
jgi:hypothetical protein